MKKYIFPFIVMLSCLIIAIGCKENTNKPIEKLISTIPVLPESELKKLAFECTTIEYIFKVLPISLSFTKNEGLETNLFFASGILPSYDTKDCKSIARKVYSIGTDIYLEAEVFFGENCHYYDFYKQGKLVYRSDMTQQGMNFYTNIIKQVAEKPQ